MNMNGLCAGMARKMNCISTAQLSRVRFGFGFLRFGWVCFFCSALADDDNDVLMFPYIRGRVSGIKGIYKVARTASLRRLFVPLSRFRI